MGLERGTLILVSTIEGLLEGNYSGSGLEIQDYGRRGSAAKTRRHLPSQQLALTSPTRGGRSVGIARSQTQATGVFLVAQLTSSWTGSSSRTNYHLLTSKCKIVPVLD
jgi:hypothetical protein